MATARVAHAIKALTLESLLSHFLIFFSFAMACACNTRHTSFQAPAKARRTTYRHVMNISTLPDPGARLDKEKTPVRRLRETPRVQSTGHVGRLLLHHRCRSASNCGRCGPLQRTGVVKITSIRLRSGLEAPKIKNTGRPPGPQTRRTAEY